MLFVFLFLLLLLGILLWIIFVLFSFELLNHLFSHVILLVEFLHLHLCGLGLEILFLGLVQVPGPFTEIIFDVREVVASIATTTMDYDAFEIVNVVLWCCVLHFGLLG